MGIELDVLVGHPEHELLFVATQVAKATGLKDGSRQARRIASEDGVVSLRASEAMQDKLSSMRPASIHAPRWASMYLFPESTTYQMLLRGHAPQSEPFRKWVTEEVLPAIRKTGKYNAEESTNPIAQGVIDQLKALEGIILKQGEAIESLRQELSAKTFSLQPSAVETLIVSPYEGQPGIALCDPAGFDVRTYRELGEELLSRPALDRPEGYLTTKAPPHD